MTDRCIPAPSATTLSSLPESLHVRAREAAVQAQRYLAGRQSRTGGFCFYRWLGIDEPTLRDTWHAVAALRLLDADVPRRDEVVAFLRSFRGAGFDDLYHRTLALANLGERGDPDAIARIDKLDAAATLADPNLPVNARLQRALRIITMQNSLATIRTADAVAEYILDLCDQGGWGDKPNLPDTWLALAILDRCGYHAITGETRAFVDALQTPSFGFTATRDSTWSPLEVLHAGLRACVLLRLPVRHPTDAVAGVLACQTGNGGFARTADALPDIALTHLGLLALAAAGALPVGAAAGMRDDSGF